MTQQNVVLSKTKSGINRDLTVAQKPPAAPGGYIPIPRRRVLKNLEINGGQRINAWVDSMRASSPTNSKSNSSFAEEHNSWIVRTHNSLFLNKNTSLFNDLWIWSFSNVRVTRVFVKQLRHPSALDMFEQIMDASRGKQIVMFLDYDGTLSPIVDDPDRAFMSDSVSIIIQEIIISYHWYHVIYIIWLLTCTWYFRLSDEENGEETCEVFSHCYSYRQMQRQGMLNFNSVFIPFFFFFFRGKRK